MIASPAAADAWAARLKEDTDALKASGEVVEDRVALSAKLGLPTGASVARTISLPERKRPLSATAAMNRTGDTLLRFGEFSSTSAPEDQSLLHDASTLAASLTGVPSPRFLKSTSVPPQREEDHDLTHRGYDKTLQGIPKPTPTKNATTSNNNIHWATSYLTLNAGEKQKSAAEATATMESLIKLLTSQTGLANMDFNVVQATFPPLNSMEVGTLLHYVACTLLELASRIRPEDAPCPQDFDRAIKTHAVASEAILASLVKNRELALVLKRLDQAARGDMTGTGGSIGDKNGGGGGGDGEMSTHDRTRRGTMAHHHRGANNNNPAGAGGCTSPPLLSIEMDRSGGSSSQQQPHDASAAVAMSTSGAIPNSPHCNGLRGAYICRATIVASLYEARFLFDQNEKTSVQRLTQSNNELKEKTAHQEQDLEKLSGMIQQLYKERVKIQTDHDKSLFQLQEQARLWKIEVDRLSDEVDRLVEYSRRLRDENELLLKRNNDDRSRWHSLTTATSRFPTTSKATTAGNGGPAGAIALMMSMSSLGAGSLTDDPQGNKRASLRQLAGSGKPSNRPETAPNRTVRMGSTAAGGSGGAGGVTALQRASGLASAGGSMVEQRNAPRMSMMIFDAPTSLENSLRVASPSHGSMSNAGQQRVPSPNRRGGSRITYPTVPTTRSRSPSPSIGLDAESPSMVALGPLASPTAAVSSEWPMPSPALGMGSFVQQLNLKDAWTVGSTDTTASHAYQTSTLLESHRGSTAFPPAQGIGSGSGGGSGGVHASVPNVAGGGGSGGSNNYANISNTTSGVNFAHGVGRKATLVPGRPRVGTKFGADSISDNMMGKSMNVSGSPGNSKDGPRAVVNISGPPRSSDVIRGMYLGLGGTEDGKGVLPKAHLKQYLSTTYDDFGDPGLWDRLLRPYAKVSLEEFTMLVLSIMKL